MVAVLSEPGRSTDTRERLLDVAAQLFIEHSFAGTSHRMVADAVGITKAAVHYHFRTREELLFAVMEPFLGQRLEALTAAEAMRSPRKQALAMVSGYANVVCRNPSLAAVLTYDPSVIRAVQLHPEWGPLVKRESALLAAPTGGARGLMRAFAVLTGLPGAAAATPVDMARDDLRQELVDLGLRILGLKASPRPSAEPVHRQRQAP